jgi:hypothetical protein
MFRSREMARDLRLKAYGSPTTMSPTEDESVALFYRTLREAVASFACKLGVRGPTLAWGGVKRERRQLTRLKGEHRFEEACGALGGDAAVGT